MVIFTLFSQKCSVKLHFSLEKLLQNYIFLSKNASILNFFNILAAKTDYFLKIIAN